MMNPGYLTFILLSMCAVLMVTGWKSALAGETARRHLALLAILWMCGLPLDVRIGSWLEMNGAAAALSGASLAALARIRRERSNQEAACVLAAALAIGCMHAAIVPLLRADPDLVRVPSLWVSSCAAAVGAGLFTRKASGQFAAVTIGLLAGEAALQMLGDSRPVRLGDMAFHDLWWVAIAGARSLALASACAQGAWRGLLRLVRSGSNRGAR